MAGNIESGGETGKSAKNAEGKSNAKTEKNELPKVGSPPLSPSCAIR